MRIIRDVGVWGNYQNVGFSFLYFTAFFSYLSFLGILRSKREELNKPCFHSDPFLHSHIYQYVLNCYMYFLE